ncbi:hypothetical protein ACFSWE_00550 [Leucobacter albus]|uniref:Uncharacterized protein n=1 Tax=Leucobacter albus TaxID=272210 RepID=A0ABW3TRK4_9MICO
MSSRAEADSTPLELLAILQRSGSGSEAFLALASDGRKYWVKAPNSPQGARTLVAESIAYGVGRLIGVAAPVNAVIHIPAGLDWSFTNGVRLQGCVAHASLEVTDVVVSDEWSTYSHLDNNRQRQASILALWDLCMGGDAHWLHELSADYSIWTFDHGFWLAGESDWSVPALQRVGTDAWQQDLDPGVVSARALLATLKSVRRISLADLLGVMQMVPLEWGTTTEELTQVAELLYARIPGVTQRLAVAAHHSRYE